MYIKISGFGQGVRYRRPFYVVCTKCDFEISGDSVEDVLKLANSAGFVYDTESGITLCGDCLENAKQAAGE